MLDLITRFSTIGLLFALLSSCGPTITFEEQIASDINTYIPSGICEEFPLGTKISNVVIGEITPIEGMGMIDVSYSFDYDVNGEQGHKESAMLYVETGSGKQLASLGSDCDYEME